MVGSSITEDEKTVANRRLKIGFVLLVATSTTLMSLRIDPTPIQLAAAFGAGIAVGVVLLWFVLHNLREFRESLR
jgi:membrane protein YdbS with pleckstrin-like domain